MSPKRNKNVSIPNGASYGAPTGDARAQQVHGYGMGQGRVGAPQPQPTQAYPPNAYGAKQIGQGTQAAAQQAAYIPQQQVPYTQLPPQYAQYMAAQQMGYMPPATSVAPQERKKRKGPLFWIALIVAILAIAAAILIALNMCGTAKNRSGELGQLEGKSEAEIQAAIDRVVDEGMFNISIASIVQFQDGNSAGEIKIENVPGNRYLMRVSITLDSDGREVYESGVIEPNHHIQSDKLSVVLPAGTYPATATFTALDPTTEDEVGEAAAQITLVVLN